MKFELLNNIIEYPFIYNSELYNSYKLEQHRNCLKCKDYSCLVVDAKNNSNYKHLLCSYKFDCFHFKLSNETIVINGLILNDNNEISKERKKARSAYILKEKDIVEHIVRLQKIDELLLSEITDNIEQNFSVFHDIKTAYGLVNSSLDSYIHKQRGNTFEDKIYNCHQDIIDLYDALELVNSQIGMIDAVINPQSIIQGTKKSINIYKMFHKISKLFEYKLKNKSLVIERNTPNYQKIPNCQCYEAIEFLPLILIDNAIKYSKPNSKIVISHSYDDGGFVNTTIKSIGVVVKDEEVEKIFNKNVRGENADISKQKGIGMGLWIAKQVLIMHSTDIKYSKKLITNEIGENIFEFKIKT